MPDNEKKKLAGQHSMDIPHVTAVELPLVVKDNERAIEMLGGKQKIFQVINANNNNKSLGGIKPEDEKPMELRLRKDRFHHPIQSITSNREKVVLKISIPKNGLPSDYKQNPEKYGIRDLLNYNHQQGNEYKVNPIGIINKTHSFKSMTDFQVNTKHNPNVQKSNNLINVQNYHQLEREFLGRESESTEEQSESTDKDLSTPFLNNTDFQEPSYYENSNKHLPPPPIFSTIKFPFDYQYEKNAITMTVKDPNSGDLKVITRKADVKLYTQVVDFSKSLDVPQAPDPILVQNQKELQRQVESSEALQNSYNYDLFHCIEWLRQVFEVKPIWLRKSLEDIVPLPYRRVLKQALPHITYIYKNGPWRFCNVKYGVNPSTNPSYWKYQSEYFRINSLNIKIHNSKKLNLDDSKVTNSYTTGQMKVLPETIDVSKIQKRDKAKDQEINLKTLSVSKNLIFDGKEVPKIVTFQVGDIIDKDIHDYLEQAKANRELFSEQLDYQDGWINKQVIEVVRKIVRYKLNQLTKDEEISRSKISKIFAANYDKEDQEIDEDSLIDPDLKSSAKVKVESTPEIVPETEKENESEPESEPESDQEPLDVLDPEAEVEAEADIESDSEFVTSSESELINRVKQYDSVAAEKLAKISQITKQESIM